MTIRNVEQARAASRAYHQAHRDEILERKQANGPAYWLANHEEITQKRQAKRKAETPEEREERLQRQRIYVKTYRERHTEALHEKCVSPEGREAGRQRMAAWRAANPEKVQEANEWHKQYRAENREELSAKERARIAAMSPEERIVFNARHSMHEATRNARKRSATLNDLTVAQWQEIKAAYNHRCAYCGKKFQRLTMDHITPLAKGGSHTASNIVPACRSCNSRKHTGPPLCPVQPVLLTVAPSRKETS